MLESNPQESKDSIWLANTAAGSTALSLILLLPIFLSATPLAFAGATMIIDDEKSIFLGLGLRGSFSITEKGASNSSSSSKDFNIDNIEIYINGRFNRYIKATFNTERNSNENVSVMDAIAKFEFHRSFNLWLGRMHPPSDRANLSGPFYANVWEYPEIVSRYPGLAFGRDNGIMAWGKPAADKIVYSIGAFNGHNRAIGGSNESDNLLYAARIAINFFDPEPMPAYYVSNTYYGNKRVFSVGTSHQFQKDGIGLSPADNGDFRAWNFDFLFEDTIGTAVFTAEGAYYKYDLGGQVDCASDEPGSVPCADGNNMGLQVAGKGYLTTLAYLIPYSVGMGRLQPFLRQQKFDRDISKTTNQQTDLGINYVIDKHNARISTVYSQHKDDRLTSTNSNIGQFVIGIQMQY